MNFRKMALIIGLLGIFLIPVFTVSASPMVSPQQDNGIEFIEYLVDSVEFKER